MHDPLSQGNGTFGYEFRSGSRTELITLTSSYVPALPPPAPIGSGSLASTSACHLLPSTAPGDHYESSTLAAVRDWVDNTVSKEYAGHQYEPQELRLEELVAMADTNNDGKVVDAELLDFGYAVLPEPYSADSMACRILRDGLWCPRG